MLHMTQRQSRFAQEIKNKPIGVGAPSGLKKINRHPYYRAKVEVLQMEYVPDNYDLWVEWDKSHAEQEEDKDETQSTCTNI